MRSAKRQSESAPELLDRSPTETGLDRLPTEVIERCLISGYGKSPLHALDLDEERDRRDFLYTASLVCKEWNRLARPLLLDSVVFEARLFDQQIDQWRSTKSPKKSKRGERRGIDLSLVKVITVAPDWKKSDLQADYMSAEDRREFAISFDMQTRSAAREIIEDAASLIELRGSSWIDVEMANLRLSSFTSLYIGSWSNDCTWHEHYLEHAVADGCTEIVIRDALDRGHESCEAIGPNASPKLVRLSIGTIDDPTALRSPLFTGQATQLRHLTFYLNRWYEASEEDEDGVLINTGHLLLGSCPNLRTLIFGVSNGGMDLKAVEQFIGALPSSLEQLVFDSTELVSSRLTKRISEAVTVVAEQLADETKAPALKLLQLHVGHKVPPVGQTTAHGRAFDALRTTCANRGIQLELVKGWYEAGTSAPSLVR